MSVATEISRLQTAKSDIKTAIEAKGVTVPSSAKIDTYDDYIAAIPTGVDGGGHDYVDLGLPSGTLWATMNMGASTPEAYGDKYAVGQTTPGEPSSGYDWWSYETYLTPQHDPVRTLWGGLWRTPSFFDFHELFYETDQEVIAGYNGLDLVVLKCMNKNDHSKYIILPLTTIPKAPTRPGSSSNNVTYYITTENYGDSRYETLAQLWAKRGTYDDGGTWDPDLYRSNIEFSYDDITDPFYLRPVM